MMDLEASAGDRLRELRAASILEDVSLGEMLATLALEGLDARRT
jgi:hypothetical protein